MKCGVKEMNDVDIVKSGSMLIGKDGCIVAIGPTSEIMLKYFPQHNNPKDVKEVDNYVDCTGKVVIPGLCDGHTHPVWAGDRVHEFAMKLKGATYMDIHKMGGGINFTVQHTRKASTDELLKLYQSRLSQMLKFGTTLVEVKTGYGLNLETELKMLYVLKKGEDSHQIETVQTYLGAHSVPKGSTVKQATQDIITNQIPAIVKEQEKGTVSKDLQIDVFCDVGVFEQKETKAILECGKKNGMAINFHGDEIKLTHSAELGSEIGARSISHLENITDEGIKLMAKTKVVAVLLPSTAYILRIDPPPARKLIESGVPVALGSDFNPNAFSMSMPLIMNLSCVIMKMSMEESLNAATINSAASMGKAKTHGSLAVGKRGDFLIFDIPSWEHIIYRLSGCIPTKVFKGGILIQ